jgi:hypothetical protein
VSNATVAISADEDTCWAVAVDGRESKGCGRAEFTDSGTSHNATVRKTRGSSKVTIVLVVDGKTVSRGSVTGSQHSVSVSSGT